MEKIPGKFAIALFIIVITAGVYWSLDRASLNDKTYPDHHPYYIKDVSYEYLFYPPSH